MTPNQNVYQYPSSTPKRVIPFIAESLPLLHKSPTPSNYQCSCPPLTQTSCITPKVQVKNFKYSDLQESCQSSRFYQEWSLKMQVPYKCLNLWLNIEQKYHEKLWKLIKCEFLIEKKQKNITILNSFFGLELFPSGLYL